MKNGWMAFLREGDGKLLKNFLKQKPNIERIEEGARSREFAGARYRHFAVGIVVSILSIVSCLGMIEAAPVKPEKISAMLDIVLVKDLGQAQWAKEYQRLTGIQLVVDQPAHNQYTDKLLIAFASGNIPDVIEIQPDRVDIYMQLAQEGAIVPLDRYIANSQVFKKIDPIYINSLKINGKIYGTPLNQGGGCITYIRKDWLDNLGLKVPATWAELYQVAKAFTFNDPDGNGKNDTVGFTLPGVSQYTYMADFYQGVHHEFLQKNGKWVDGFTEPKFKEALGRLQQLYKEKIIDQEAFTNQTSTCREKFYAGKVGIISYWSGGWAETLERNTKMRNPKAEVIGIPPIKETHYWNRIAPIIAITSKAKNPEAVFKYFNEYMHDGGEGQMLFVHGVEGVHWAKKDGKYQKLPNLTNPAIPAGKAYIHPEFILHPWNDPIPMDPKIAASIKMHRTRVEQVGILPTSKTYLRFGADLLTLKEEIIAKVMMGQYTVDQGLQIYRERSAKLNVATMLKEFNAR